MAAHPIDATVVLSNTHQAMTSMASPSGSGKMHAEDSKRMRIYLMIDYYSGPIAGTEKQVFILARELSKAGHEVCLFVLRRTQYTLQAISDFPCPIECLDVHSILSLRTARIFAAFRKRILRERPHVVHAFFNDSAILAPLACATGSTKVFTSRRDMGFWYTRSILLALSLANRRVAGVICNSRAVASEVKRREKIASQKILIVPNARTTATLGDDASLPPTERPDGGIRLCLVANFRPLKRIQDLIHACALAKRKIPKLVAFIVGAPLDAAYTSSLLSLSGELSLEGTVIFRPHTDAPAQLMKQCDIGILTSESEGLSNTLMEYMACGLPIVCSAAGGNAELVEDGVNGFLYPVGDIEMLAEKIVRLSASSQLRRKLGQEGARRVQEYSPELIAAQYLGAYHD